jgi:hypothetical protein
MSKQPWERLPKEKARAYEAFKIYLHAGSGRTYADAAVGMGLSYDSICNYGKWNKWRDRALAWDDHVTSLENQRREEVVIDRAAKMERERLESVDRDLDLSKKLAARALEMLNAPLYRETEEKEEIDDDGRKVVRITREPAKWSMATAAQLATAAAQLAAVAFAQETSKADAEFDPASATMEELQAFLSKHGAGVNPKSLPAPVVVEARIIEP